MKAVPFGEIDLTPTFVVLGVFLAAGALLSFAAKGTAQRAKARAMRAVSLDEGSVSVAKDA